MRTNAPTGAIDTPPPRVAVQRFELVRMLGVGGNGAVFEAREHATAARVALKVLHEQTGLALIRFKQEFRALADLAHPNVVRFGGLFEEAGQFYFTMELVEGESFLDYVRPGAPRSDADLLTPRTFRSGFSKDGAISGPIAKLRSEVHGGVLDVGRLRGAMEQLASGLIALHAAGLVHRDVKPQNVLVTRENRVVLLDFGLALDVDDPRAPEVAGTFAYMAPEQATGRDVTPATDWYAVGAVLYEALTGRLPHSHRTYRNFWEESRAEIPHPSTYASGLPDDLCALALDLLQFDPKERPDEASIAHRLGMEAESARARASFRSQVGFAKRVFVGRDRELEALRAAVDRAQEGAAAVVRIEGESGIGKSALMRQLLSELHRRGKIVALSSRCYERERVPYRGIDGVIDALVRQLEASTQAGESFAQPKYAEYLAEVFPVVRALPGFEGLTRPEDFELDPHEARRRTAQALMQLLTWQAAEHPVLVHLDDAQWLDADSAALLSFLVQEATPRTLIVIATRPKADDPLTEMVRRAKNSTDIVLEPLSVEDSETLARLMLERTGRESINPGNVARQSGGHPLFIHELVLHATRAEPVGSLEGAIATRLERLDESSRGLLDLVALADAPLPHPVALAASALRPDVYPWVLSTLRGENLVSFHALSSDDDVHAYHDRIRELVVQRMSPATRRDTHARLAQAIEECSPEALDALAHHFAGAEQAEPAVRYARAAGENAIQKLAFEHAAALFRLALEHEREPRARGELEASLGHALASSGRGALAAEAYLRAASLAENFQALELQRRAGEQLLRAGHVEEGTHILFGMLRELGLAVPESDLMAVLSLMWTLVKLKLRGWKLRRRTGPLSARDRLRLDACWTVATGLSIVHHLRATEFQARALLLALNAGDADRVMKSTALLGATLGMADGVARTIGGGLRVRARELASTFPSDENTAWLELTQGVASMGDWDFAGCERLCAQAEATLRTRCQGAAWEVVTAQAFALWSATFRGNFATASLRLPALLASARSRGDRHAETALILSPVHLMGLCDDEPERVRLQCETSMAEWPSRLARFQHMCGAYVLAQVALYESRVDTAWEHVTYAWQMLRRGHLSRVQFQRIDLLGLRARTALGRAAAAEEALRTEWLGRAQADVRRLRKENAPAAFALADMVEGGAEHVVGNAAASISCLERAAQGFDALGMPLHAEVARLARGIVAKDELGRTRASKNLGDIGVVNPTRMMRLWIPGIA